MLPYLVLPEKLRHPVWLYAKSYDRGNRAVERYDLRDLCRPEHRILAAIHRNMCAGNLWGVSCDTVAMTAATLQTVLGIKCPSNICETVTNLDCGFDGTDSTKGPAIIQVCSCTWATNGPGTNSTSVTPALYGSGRPETLQLTAGKHWTSQPTVLTVIREFNIPTYMGSGLIPLPLTFSIVAGGGNGCAINATTPTGSAPNFCGSELGNE
jgi:hypothetical protein